MGDIGEDFEYMCWKDLRVFEIAVFMETTSVGYRYGNLNVNDEMMIFMLYGLIESIEIFDFMGCMYIGDWCNFVWDCLSTRFKTFRCARISIFFDDGVVVYIFVYFCFVFEVFEFVDVGVNVRFVIDVVFE